MRTKILSVLAGLALLGFGFFIWEEMKLENQLRALDKFCMELKLQTPLNDIETTTNFSPTLRLILLEQSTEGSQDGSIYFEGSGRYACSVSFMRGRLARKSYGAGNLAQEPGEPRKKLKPW